MNSLARRAFLALGFGLGLGAISKKPQEVSGDLISYTRFQGKWIRFVNQDIDSLFVKPGEVLDALGIDRMRAMIDQDEVRRKH